MKDPMCFDIVVGPKIPMQEHKVGRTIYEFPDFEALNETATKMFDEIIRQVGENPETACVGFEFAPESRESIKRAASVVMALSYGARVFRGGWYRGSFITSYTFKGDQVFFEITEPERLSKSIRKAKQNDNTVYLKDIVVALVDDREEERKKA